jgi:DNA-directed RNA polymerase specialized sigma subunit
MIRNESEYQQALARMNAERTRLDEHIAAWKAQGFTTEQVARLREPLESFHLQLVEEVGSYERLKRGQFDELENLHGLGQVLIGLRIFLGMTQRQLAGRLGVSEAMVSRDERNEYHGITVERAERVISALGGVRLITRVVLDPPTDRLPVRDPEFIP